MANDPSNSFGPGGGFGPGNGFGAENNQQKRMLIVLAVAFVATAIFMTWFGPQPQAAGELDAGVAVAGPADAGFVPVAAAPPAADVDGGTAEAAPAEPPAEVKTISAVRPSVHYTFSTQGASLVDAVLQGEKMRDQKEVGFVEGFARFAGKRGEPAPQMDLAVPIAAEVPGFTNAGLPLGVAVTAGGGFAPSTVYRVVEEREGFLSMRGRSNGFEVTKTFQWPKEGFELLMSVTVKNTGAQAQSGTWSLSYAREIDPNHEEAPSFFGSVGNQSAAVCKMEADDVERRLPGDDADPVEGKSLHFFGIDQQYFTSALFPLDGPKEATCTLLASPTQRISQVAFPLQLGPGAEVTQHFGGFLGPRDTDLLGPVPSMEAARQLVPTPFNPELEEMVDFGIWAVIAKLLLGIMKFFHGVFGNWGLAVILLTVLVKVVLLPLTHKSMVAAEQMKKLQPQIEVLRKKFGEDRERMNMEMMKLYKEAQVNPLGGCLPMLIQMPVWIALFTALRNSYDLYNEPFFGPVWTDLTMKDPTYLLPILLGATMIVTQKLQPQMMDATQAKIMTWVMPIFFTFIMLNYPAGLTLYIFTNNVLSIGQQYGLRKYLEGKAQKKGAAT